MASFNYTKRYVNLNTEFTVNGSITAINGLCGGLTTGRVNGSTQYYSSSDKPISIVGGKIFTFIGNIKNPVEDGANGVFYAQNDAVNSRIWTMFIDSSDNLKVIVGLATDNITSVIAAGHKNWDDANPREVGFRVNATELDIIVDGVPASSYVSQSVMGGGGWLGVASNPANFSIGANGNGSTFSNYTPDHPRFIEEEFLSDAQLLEDYALAQACFPSGDADYADSVILLH